MALLLLRCLAWLFVTSILFATPARSELSISSLWKARAFEAIEKGETLQRNLKQIPWESKEADFVKCQIMVEAAFMMHLTHEDLAHKRDEKADVFHFILNGGEQAGLFDLAYLYSPAGNYEGVRIDLLPKNWHLYSYPDTPGFLALRSANGQCVFGFSLTNPFESMAIDPRK